METDQGRLLLTFSYCNCSLPILLVASLGELLVWYCVSRASLLCTDFIYVGKSSHLFYCNCIIYLVYTSFSEGLANPVLAFAESGKELTTIGGTGTQLLFLGSYCADLKSCSALSVVEEMYAYSLTLHSDFEGRGVSQNCNWLYFKFLSHLAAAANPQSCSHFGGLVSALFVAPF